MRRPSPVRLHGRAIKACEAHFKDTAGFRLQANELYRRLRFHIFRDPPLPNVTIGGNGHVFLNSPVPTSPYTYFDSLCVRQGAPSPELIRQLDETLSAATRFFRRRGAEVVFAVAPSTLALYPDRLPRAVPALYRKTCSEYPTSDHLLARLERQSAAAGGYSIFYPYDLFAAHKEEAGFYPRERYHWEGKSVYLFARHLVHAVGAVDALVLDDPATPAPVEDDIAMFFGFSRHIDGYAYAYAGKPSLHQKREDWIRNHTANGMLIRADTSASLSDKHALLIAKSFGVALMPHLARCFRMTHYLDLNFITDEEKPAAFSAIGERLRQDYVFFVFDDQSMVYLPSVLAAFAGLNEKEDLGETGAPSAPNGSSR